MTTEEKFLAAVRVINSLPKNGPFQPSQNLALKLHAYQQQATKGICNTSRPSLLNSDRHKWHAWKKLGNMSKETAMKKYIEELSKVIETMSYTEAVSNFMDIMYPFYEIVWVDDDRDSDNLSEEEEKKEYHPNFRTFSSEESMIPHPIPEADSQLAVTAEQIQLQYCEESWINADEHEVQLFLNEYQGAFKGNAFANDRTTHVLQEQSSYLNDPLTSSVFELQKSLDGIVEQLNSLEYMAQIYSNQLQKESSSKPKENNWKFPPFTLLFVLSWPFIAYWLFQVFQRHRRLRSR